MSRSTVRRGFASVLAITMLALVSSAVVMLTTHFAFEVTRTRTAWEDAQLRQALLAGAADAAARAKSWGDRPAPAHWQVNLSHLLADAGADISLDSAAADSADSANVQISARFNQREAVQTLRFHHTGGKWNVTGAAWGE